MADARPVTQRIDQAVHRLETEANVWVTTASPEGEPHLVPLSLAWDGEAVLVATPGHTVTARNIDATGRARAALDDASDVVILDAEASVTPVRDVDSVAYRRFVERVGWDPTDEADDWVLLRLRPHRIQAWNGIHEMSGRTVMRRGVWLT